MRVAACSQSIALHFVPSTNPHPNPDPHTDPTLIKTDYWDHADGGGIIRCTNKRGSTRRVCGKTQ